MYSVVKEDILNANIKPSSVLDEVQLMQRFGVSRTPAREVIRRLAASGLVTIEAHRSAVVKHLSMIEIGDFFEAYLLTQRTIFILSAHRISEEQIEKASRLQDRIAAACQAANTRAVRELNLQFHSVVAAGCSNTYLQSTYARLLEDEVRLSALLLRFAVETDWREHAQHITRDHDGILEALRAHDTVAAAKYSDAHIHFFQERVYRALEKKTPAVPLPDVRQLRRA
jgi:DNA-binding GntR family transcriptional regulator